MYMCTNCNDPHASADAATVKPVDVVITGLNTILPLMNEEILKVSTCSCSGPPDFSCVYVVTRVSLPKQ